MEEKQANRNCSGVRPWANLAEVLPCSCLCYTLCYNYSYFIDEEIEVLRAWLN